MSKSDHSPSVQELYYKIEAAVSGANPQFAAIPFSALLIKLSARIGNLTRILVVLTVMTTILTILTVVLAGIEVRSVLGK
jgi:hypothetical protein